MKSLPQNEVTAELYNRLDTIALAAVNAAETIKLLTSFTCIQGEEKRQAGIDINQVVLDVVRITGPFWRDEPQRRGITIQMEVKTGSVKPVAGSVSELIVALANIIINAVEAMPHGGKITIKTWYQGNSVHVNISDTGQGIPGAIDNKLFEPFFTTKGEGHSGLGLSSSLAAVNREGGDIRCVSEEGKGASFIVRLPVSLYSVKGGEKGSTPSIPERKHRSILIVDDDVMVCEPLLMFFQMRGYHVRSETNPQKALDVFTRGPFDMVITNLGMPQVSGRQMATAIKNIHPRTKVVLLTGWQVSPDDPLLKEGLVDFIVTKPIRREEVFGIMDRAFPDDA